MGDVLYYIGDLDTSDEQVRWGNNDDPRGLLSRNTPYEVAGFEVHKWHTKIYLVAFPGKRFNSVHFRNDP